MSETVRSFTGARSFSMHRKRRPKRFRWLALFLVLATATYALWIVRDTHTPQQFIADGQRMHVAIRDFSARRDAWSASPVWKLLPENHWLAEVETIFAQDIALPEWILDNLVGRTCLISGSRNDESKGMVFVTRMSPVGVLLERVNRFTPGIQRDKAGGLQLLFARENEIYYAVRGRVLLVSASRRALVTALTLAPNERIAPDVLDAAIADQGDEDVRGSVALRDDEPLGRFFHTLSFAVRVDATRAQARLQGALRDEWRGELTPLLPTREPRNLAPAPEGLFQISADLPASPEAIWPAVGKLVNAFGVESPLSSDQWREWKHESPEDSPARHVTALLANAPGAFTLAWDGFNMDTEVPCPILFGQFQNIALPEEETPAPWPLRETPSIAWHASARGDAAFLALGPTTTAPVEVTATDAPPSPGHVHLRWKPADAAQAVIEAGKTLSQNNMLTPQADASFDAWAREWANTTSGVRELNALFSHRDGIVDIELTILCEGD